MIYAMADILGDFDGFKEMLDKIHFSEKDKLYVLGNCIGGHLSDFEVLFEIMKHPNITPIPTGLSVFLGRLVGMPALITAVQEILKKYRPIGKSNRDFVFQLKLNLNVLIMRYATLANFINSEEFPEKSLNLVNEAHNA